MTIRHITICEVYIGRLDKILLAVQKHLRHAIFFEWCRTFLKSLLTLLQYCFCFRFWLSGLWACRILAHQTCTPCTGRWNPNHWLPGKSLNSCSPRTHWFSCVGEISHGRIQLSLNTVTNFRTSSNLISQSTFSKCPTGDFDMHHHTKNFATSG